MANKITVEITGQTPAVHDGVATVGELMDKLELKNYSVSVNGEPADRGYELSDYEFVTFAPSVKGASV